MKNVKNKLLLATAIIALASCSENTYLGDQENNTQGTGAISFGGGTPSLTRAEGAAAATELGNSFQVYATKTVGSTTSNVFAQSKTGETTVPYWVWYVANTANTTTSNTNNWEYVGTGGTVITLSTTEQTIKYWDYSADQYDFVAFKAKPVTVGETTAAANITNVTTTGFTVEGSAAQLGGLYVADKKVITSDDYKKVVQFTFRNAATKVRLGIYETIPGYDVKNVSFRPNSTSAPEFAATTDNAKLSGSFNGTSSAASGTYNVSYATSEPHIAIFNADNTTTNIRSGYFDFGTFASASTALGTTSTTPTWASGSADYQGVLPNTDNVGNMVLYVDYQLYNAKSGETINVKGAKAVVPSNYMKWNPNYAYTYLFKISDNTNGTTGTEGTSPEGLYPITLDAITIAATEGQEVGTITTVSTPAITTYQEGSVVDIETTEPAVSKHGITYAHANGPIYITVYDNEAGTLKNLTTANTKLYTVISGTTEADLVLNVKTKTEVTSGSADALKVPLDEGETLQGITFATSTTAKFTPNASTTYAVRFLYSEGSATATTAEYNPATTYYSITPDADGFYSVVNPIPDDDLNSEKNAWKDNDAKAKYTTNPTQPVYQYKIIVVAP